MSIKRKYSRDNAECKVTFRLPQEIVNNFKTVSVVGEFNNWDIKKNIFVETETDGSFSTNIIVPSNNSYQFRYLGDGVNWFNETEADQEVDSYFEGSKNSVINI